MTYEDWLMLYPHLLWIFHELKYKILITVLNSDPLPPPQKIHLIRLELLKLLLICLLNKFLIKNCRNQDVWNINDIKKNLSVNTTGPACLKSKLHVLQDFFMLLQTSSQFSVWFTGIFRSNSLFLGANARKAVNEGRADTIPIFLCEIPHLFRRRIIDIDVALVTVAPPDKHGFCSLGTSVDCTRSAIQNARYIIGI